MRARVGLLVAAVLLLLAGRSPAADFKLKLPLGVQEDAAQIPDDNPVTPEKIALGKKFFWDKRWSAAGAIRVGFRRTSRASRHRGTRPRSSTGSSATGSTGRACGPRWRSKPGWT